MLVVTLQLSWLCKILLKTCNLRVDGLAMAVLLLAWKIVRSFLLWSRLNRLSVVVQIYSAKGDWAYRSHLLINQLWDDRTLASALAPFNGLLMLLVRSVVQTVIISLSLWGLNRENVDIVLNTGLTQLLWVKFRLHAIFIDVLVPVWSLSGFTAQAQLFLKLIDECQSASCAGPRWLCTWRYHFPFFYT